MSNCTEEIQSNKIEFGRLGRRVVEDCFDGSSMTSDADVMLLGGTDRKHRFDASRSGKLRLIMHRL